MIKYFIKDHFIILFFFTFFYFIIILKLSIESHFVYLKYLLSRIITKIRKNSIREEIIDFTIGKLRYSSYKYH